MNRFLLVAFFLAKSVSLFAERNSISCQFEENLPFGVSAWNQSERVRNGLGKEDRFDPYQKGTAADLANDALVQRGGESAEGTFPRQTAFWQAYNEKGWYIYIESKEPLVNNLLARLLDPHSPGRAESYEVFFMPGLTSVPYYQVLINPYINKTTFYDWDMPSSDYRSLKDDTHVESLPLADGIGTFIFIPWHLLYEHVPLEGGDWRFTLIRWMPFAKAGGITWGGKVHETGQFGNVHFEKPTENQREAIERRLLQSAWFKFQAIAGQRREYVNWDDNYVGDPEFYEKVLTPEIKRMNGIGEKWGDPERWTVQQLREGMAHLKDFMEFDYQKNALRTHCLKQKILSEE